MCYTRTTPDIEEAQSKFRRINLPRSFVTTRTVTIVVYIAKCVK